MMRRFFAWLAGVGRPDPETLFEEITRSAQSNYGGMDRYADFRAVLLESEQGRRVLHQILSWSHIYRASAMGNPIDPYRAVFNEGERNIGLKILGTLHAEPAARPEQTARNK